MSESLKLGELITSEQHRDAVHVAVMPVTVASGCMLAPGQHVGLDATGRASSEVKPIGIIDPFLKVSAVYGNQLVWLFLYPGSITSLRHEWTHPAITPTDEIAEAMKVITSVGEICGLTAQRMIDSAKEFIEYGEFTYMGSNENYKDVPDWHDFWAAIKTVTGLSPKDGDEGSYFSCSC